MALAQSSLDKIFNPTSIAVIGASDEEGSIGRILMDNLTHQVYRGRVYPVNIRKSKILGLKAYRTVGQLPETVDLAIIATPAKTVPDLIEQCGTAEISGAIIISAGFREVGSEGKVLEQKILEARDRCDLRIIGPNCLGIIRPSIALNATFTKRMPKAGSIAFISQSGALGTAILDWATYQNIGFSIFASVGSMIDVDFGDLIDYFGTDLQTRSILMYIEGIAEARRFMSATRHFARTKPIIVVKAGKFVESAKAAASHTGSLTGEDKIYEAAFKRAGLVRVEEIGDLFDSAEVLGLQPLPNGPNLAVVTNAGGPGVMATDALIARGGRLATLSFQTMERLSSLLPSYWSKGNPIDILGDARHARYRDVVEACLRDKGVDGLIIIYTAQAVGSPVEIARSIVETYQSQDYCNKVVLTSFMGHGDVLEANSILTDGGLPTFSTPEQAVRAYVYMYQYKRNLELLYETPEELPVDIVPPRRPAMVILRHAAAEDRGTLTEPEAKMFLDYCNIPVLETLVAQTLDEALTAAVQVGYPVVLKILSPQIIHKTDAGCVMLNIASEAELRKAYELVMRRAKEQNPDAEIRGVTVQPMVTEEGYEVILGAKKDEIFGPVILFGMGGIGVEVFQDFSLGLPPLNQTLARRIMEETKIYQLLKGYRNKPPANTKLLEEIMVRFSQMLADFPQIREVDINPLFVDEKKAFALDARMFIDKDRVFTKTKPHEHLVISPYPKKYEALWKLRDGRTVVLRPIKPEDEPLWLEMFQNFSEESIRYRFFQIIKDTPHEVRVRYCNIDYDREIAIVAELSEQDRRRILGVVRLIIEPSGKTGEIAFIVADPWQGLGLGTKMVDYMIELCKDRGLGAVYAVMLRDNRRAIKLMKKMGFAIGYLDDGTAKATLDLTKEEPDSHISRKKDRADS